MDLTSLRRQQRAAPTTPGVYFFRDGDGQALYIGKAKSLRHRLASHLSHPSTRGGTRLLDETASLDYIICDSEWQALLLEQELISEQQPRYNIALRFGRRYPRIAVSMDETFPRVYVSAERPLRGRRYFGPYEGTRAHELVSTLTHLYRLRSCEGRAPGRASGSPGLDFHIRRCDAPCVGFVSADAYAQTVAQVLSVLSGDWQSATTELELRMRAAATSRHFEDAARWRDDFLRLQRLCGRDATSAQLRVRACDAFAFARDGEHTHVQLLRIREHALAGRDSFILENTAAVDGRALLREALLVAYAHSTPPPLILLPQPPEDVPLLAQLLTQRRGHKVLLRVPQRGELVRVIALAQRNAEASLVRAHT
jgi:excinuclease ABC subunit C